MSAQSEEDAGEFADSRPDEDIGDNFWDPHNLADKLPHEVGLSPLHCRDDDCDADEIYDWPCPECSFGSDRPDDESTLTEWSE